MNYIEHQINKILHKLRKTMKQHANTYATRYKWCDNLSLSQAQEKYISIVLSKMPEIWSEQLDHIYLQIDKKYDKKYLFNIPQEARELFISSWSEIDEKPSWLVIEE